MVVVFLFFNFFRRDGREIPPAYALPTASHCSVSRAYANPAVSPAYNRCYLGYTIRSFEDRASPMVQDHSNCHLNHCQIKEMHRSKRLRFIFEINAWWVGENYGIRACQCSGCISIQRHLYLPSCRYSCPAKMSFLYRARSKKGCLLDAALLS